MDKYKFIFRIQFFYLEKYFNNNGGLQGSWTDLLPMF